MYESSGFRRMVAPHLPKKPDGNALGLARDDEGWEAMAMRDELTDVMLHSAFGEAIFREVMPQRRGVSADRVWAFVSVFELLYLCRLSCASVLLTSWQRMGLGEVTTAL